MEAVFADTRISVVAAIGLFYLAVCLLLRLVLFFVFGAPAGASAIVLLPTIGLGVGARVYGSERIPLQSYEIPLLIMAPGRMHPQQVAGPISQMDIAPTVLGLLGLPYEAPFFGQNVFAANEQSRVLLFNHNHDVALYQDGTLAVLGLNSSLRTYRCRLGEDRLEDCR